MHLASLLHAALRIDAIASLAAGLLTCVLAHPLAAEIGAADGWLLAAGLFMLAYGLAIGALSRRRSIAARLAWAVIVGNLLWVAGSVWLAFSHVIAPSGLGLAFLLGQAAAVAAITLLQFQGARASAVPSRA